MKFSGIDKDTFLVTPMQVSPSRIASIADYTGTDEERLFDLIDDHLSYLNNWNGSNDFSFTDRCITDIRHLEDYILVVKNNKDKYVRITLPLDELEYYKELIEERAELILENDGHCCHSDSDIESIENSLLKG